MRKPSNEKRVYGEFFDEKMLARLKRDKAPGTVKPCIIELSRYKVKGYYYIDDYGRAWTYKLRRDGKVERSWVDHPIDQIEEIEGNVIEIF
jgi:hypothetical protein